MLAVVAVVFLLQWPLRLRSMSMVDEGAVFQIAQDVCEGKRLYADAVHYAFPGIFWLTAAVFSLVGPSAAAGRTLAIAIFAVASGAMYAIGRWSLSRVGALALVVLFVAYRMVAYPHWQMLNYSSLAVALALVATALLGTGLGQRRLAPFVLAGAATAAALLTKQDSGGTTAAALGLVVLLPPPAGAPARGRTVAAFIGGAALVLGTAAAAVWHGGYAPEMLRESVLAPLYGVRHFAYPGVPSPWPFFRQDAALRGELFNYIPPILFDVFYWGAVQRSWLWRATALPDATLKLVFHLPWMLLVAGAVAAVRGGGAGSDLERRRRWLLVLLAAAFLAAFNPPRDWVHLLVLYPSTLLLGTTLVARAVRARPLLRGIAFGAVGLAAAGALVLALRLCEHDHVPIGGPRGGLLVAPEQAGPLQVAIDDLAGAAPAGTPLAALPYHPLLNFLSARPGASRYYVVWPVDLDDSRDAQVIRALDTRPDTLVVYSTTLFPHFPPFREYAPQLYDYLIDHYEVDGALGAKPGALVFMRLRRSEAPAGRSLLGPVLPAARVLREPFDGPAREAAAEERAELVTEARWPFAHVLAIGSLADAAVAVAYRLTPSAGEHFRARCGVDPDHWDLPAPSVAFTVAVRDAGFEEPVFTASADPFHLPADRRWQDVDVDLARWTGRPVDLVLRVAGPRGAPGVPARGGWADPRIALD